MVLILTEIAVHGDRMISLIVTIEEHQSCRDQHAQSSLLLSQSTRKTVRFLQTIISRQNCSIIKSKFLWYQPGPAHENSIPTKQSCKISLLHLISTSHRLHYTLQPLYLFRSHPSPPPSFRTVPANIHASLLHSTSRLCINVTPSLRFHRVLVQSHLSCRWQ